MQVNSAQDYLTQYKRRIIAKQFTSDPGPANRRNNTIYTSLVANGATQRVRFVVPLCPGGASYSSQCCVGTA